jgi:hypothetical protein
MHAHNFIACVTHGHTTLCHLSSEPISWIVALAWACSFGAAIFSAITMLAVLRERDEKRINTHNHGPLTPA